MTKYGQKWRQKEWTPLTPEQQTAAQQRFFGALDEAAAQYPMFGLFSPFIRGMFGGGGLPFGQQPTPQQPDPQQPAGENTAPGLLNRPYTNPWATRNPWNNT